MPRGNRHFLPRHVWPITHRCHKKEFLLKFARDRRQWLHWLFEARKRYGLSVLNYIVTSNHLHLLVRDRGHGEIAGSMQLIAGRTGQEYNQRKGRKGAFWEDRYQATAVETNEYLAQCMLYIDLNMVRAGVVAHPKQWAESGYRKVHYPPKRYRIIDVPGLMELMSLAELEQLQQARAQWVDGALERGLQGRDGSWTESLAVGSEQFVAGIKRELGMKARHREVAESEDAHMLREPAVAFSRHFGHEMGLLSPGNGVFWEQS